MSGGVEPYDIKWYKLSVAQNSATSSTTNSSSTIEFTDGGYVSMNKDGFYLIDNWELENIRRCN